MAETFQSPDPNRVLPVNRYRCLALQSPRYLQSRRSVSRWAIVSDHRLQANSSPIQRHFQRFGANPVPLRSSPIVTEHRELVGPLTIEIAQKTPIFTGYCQFEYRSCP